MHWLPRVRRVQFGIDFLIAGRVAAQIVSGIGFLGAGVIMREGMNIRGLNTAATLWCSAGIGVCADQASSGMPPWPLINLCANIVMPAALINCPCSMKAKNAMPTCLTLALEEAEGKLCDLFRYAQAEGKTERRGDDPEYRKLLDLIMGNMGGNKIIASVSCHAI
jgi:putative Mg2+ transporter-C (MgtC) family protein